MSSYLYFQENSGAERPTLQSADLWRTMQELHASGDRDKDGILTERELGMLCTEVRLKSPESIALLALKDNFAQVKELSDDQLMQEDKGVSLADLDKLSEYGRSTIEEKDLLEEFSVQYFGLFDRDRDNCLAKDELQAMPALKNSSLDQTRVDEARKLILSTYERMPKSFQIGLGKFGWTISRDNLQKEVERHGQLLPRYHPGRVARYVFDSACFQKADMDMFFGDFSVKEFLQASSNLQKSLHEKFGVTFSTDSQKQTIQGNDYFFRSPRLKELQATAAALELSKPAQYVGPNKIPVKFCFLQSAVSDLAHAHFKLSARAIYLSPLDPRFLEGGIVANSSEFTAVIRHELAHNSLHTVGDDFMQSLSSRLGWKRDNNGSLALVDSDGNAYIHSKTTYSEKGDWVRAEFFKGDSSKLSWQDNIARACNALFGEQGQRVSSAELSTRLAVRPITNYFDSPAEMLAEALMYFRGGSKTRTELMRKSPTLYQCAKEIDAKEIDQIYGKNGQGQPRLVRGFSGRLVENCLSERQYIEALEK